MRLIFAVDETPASFKRNGSTGSVVLHVGDESFKIGAGLNPFRPVNSWTWNVGSREVSINRKPNPVYGAFRQADYTIMVDGTEIPYRIVDA